jgi:hypothetical protein
MSILYVRDNETKKFIPIPAIKGNDGVGIQKTEINENGELKVTYTDGTVANLGKLPQGGGGEWQELKNITVENVSSIEEVIEGIENAKDFIIYTYATKLDGTKITLNGSLSLKDDKKGICLHYYKAITNGTAIYPSGAILQRFIKINDNCYLREAAVDITGALDSQYGIGTALSRGIISADKISTGTPKGTIAITFGTEVDSATIKIYAKF